MADIKRIKRQRPQEARIDLGHEDSITLVFDAEAVTPRWMSETMVNLEAQNVLAISDALARVIISWDVTDEGAAFPPTPENISILSFGAINRLYERVCEASGPSDAEGNASAQSAPEPHSVSAPALASSPNGSATSPSLTPSASLPVT